MRSEPSASLTLKVAALGGLLFLHLPLALIVLYAFSAEDKSYVFPPPALTTQWFGVAWAREDIWPPLWLSLKVAAISTALAMVLAPRFGRDADALLLGNPAQVLLQRLQRNPAEIEALATVSGKVARIRLETLG